MAQIKDRLLLKDELLEHVEASLPYVLGRDLFLHPFIEKRLRFEENHPLYGWEKG